MTDLEALLRKPDHVTIQLRGPDGDVANVPWEAALVRVLGEINSALQRIALRMEAHDAAST